MFQNKHNSPQVDLRSLGNLAQSVSEKAEILKEEKEEKNRPKCSVFWRYLRILLTACQCKFLGQCILDLINSKRDVGSSEGLVLKKSPTML